MSRSYSTNRQQSYLVHELRHLIVMKKSKEYSMWYGCVVLLQEYKYIFYYLWLYQRLFCTCWKFFRCVDFILIDSSNICFLIHSFESWIFFSCYKGFIVNCDLHVIGATIFLVNKICRRKLLLSNWTLRIREDVNWAIIVQDSATWFCMYQIF